MKTTKRILLVALLAGMCSFGYAQTKYEWEKPVQPSETEIGIINHTVDGGYFRVTDPMIDKVINYTKEQLYEKLLTKAKNEYANIYPKFTLRNFKYDKRSKDITTYGSGRDYTPGTSYTYIMSASVVIPDAKKGANRSLSQAIDKAFRNVRQDSRIAIDQITVWSGIDKEDYKDQLIDVLIDKGYRVVAKEYLQKLYQEQQDQLNSGLYNPDTTVEGSKFSAVGYFINVKVTETSIRVQVVNVSTGEYEGNATVNF
jgi:hypothetical protein